MEQAGGQKSPRPAFPDTSACSSPVLVIQPLLAKLSFDINPISLSQHHLLIIVGEVENSEFSETSENQFSEVFNSEFSILHYTQNGKLGDENLGVLFQAFLPNSEFFQLRVFHFAQRSKRKTRRWKTSEFDQTALEKTPRFSSPSFPF